MPTTITSLNIYRNAQTNTNSVAMRYIALPVAISLLALFCAAPLNAQELAPQSTICIEASTGIVLEEENADLVRPPASMIKLIMMLLVDEGVEQGKWPYDKAIPISLHAEKMGGTQVYLNYGETWPLIKLMEALSIASANDAAMAISESLWGSEEAYRAAMFERTQSLGMTRTRFYSVHGLPPDPGESPDQTTARDMTRLAQACIQRPNIMQWTGMQELQFRPEDPLKYNTNKLLWRMPDCDGLKTGYIRAAGFCVAATAERNGVRLISVVMGSPSKYGRFNRAEEMMDQGFDEVQPFQVARANQPFGDPVPVLDGKPAAVTLIAQENLSLPLSDSAREALEYHHSFSGMLEPPLKAGTHIGTVQVQLQGQILGEFPVTIAQDLHFDGWHLSFEKGVAKWEGLDTPQSVPAP